MQVKFARLSQGVLCDAFQLVQGDKVVVNEKKDILKISIHAAIQFAEGDAVWIGNVDFQVPKLTDADAAFRASFW